MQELIKLIESEDEKKINTEDLIFQWNEPTFCTDEVTKQIRELLLKDNSKINAVFTSMTKTSSADNVYNLYKVNTSIENSWIPFQVDSFSL